MRLRHRQFHWPLLLLLVMGLMPVWVPGQSGGGNLPVVTIETIRHASEAGLVPGEFRISRTAPFDQALEVDYLISGSASNGWDYLWLPGRITIPAGAKSAPVMVVPYDHEVDEPSETVELTLVPRNRPFTLAVLPDTQTYTGMRVGGSPEMLTAQTEWILSAQHALNIRYVLHEGDCTELNNLVEWQRFKTSMQVLDGRVPYAIAVGNHDGLDTPFSYTAYFNQFFNFTNYVGRPDFGGIFEAGRMDNCYHLFSAGGVDWLILSLEFGPREGAVDWANQILARHPNRRVIYLSHAHVYTDNTLHGSSTNHLWTPASYKRTNSGFEIWNKLLQPNANSALAFSGHILGLGTGRLVTTNAGGQRVFQMLANYQTRALGGGGHLRLVKFFPEEDRMAVTTYSPFLDRWMTDSENQFEYTHLGMFSNTSPGYLIAPDQVTASLMLTNDDQSTYPPKVVSVAHVGLPPVFAVTFDMPVETGSAETLTNYIFKGGLRLISAHRHDDQRTVYLAADKNPVDGASCVLTVNGVRNLGRGVPMAAPHVHRFIYRPIMMADWFTQPGMADWTVVDDTTFPTPSFWMERNGRLFQLSNLYGPGTSAVDKRQGTHIFWNPPEAMAWTDYAVTVTFRNSDDDGVGVLFHYQNRSNYYKLELDAQRNFRKLFKKINGVETLLAQETGGYLPGKEHTLRVLVVSNELVMRLNGEMLFNKPIFDDSLAFGTFALYSWGSEGLDFSKLSVSPASFAPRIVIASPGAEEHFNRGSVIPISVAGSDPDGDIVWLELFANNTLLGRFTNAPYDFEWSGAPTGGHTLQARAMDDYGLVSYSRPVYVRVDQATEPPKLVQEPEGRLAAAGDGVAFAANALSTAAVAYQWYRDGQPIAGATNRLFFVNSVKPSDVGAYWVTALNQFGAAASGLSVLRVTENRATLPGNETALRLSVYGVNENRHPVLALQTPPASNLWVQTSAALTSSNWQTLTRVTHPGGTYYFTDTATTNAPARFYRALQQP